MVREYDHHPPASSGYFEESDLLTYNAKPNQMRKMGFHKFQNFTILDGSGNPQSTEPKDQQLFIQETTGSGPLYDTWLIYRNPPSGDFRASGVNLVQPGDFLAVGDLDATGTIVVVPSDMCFHKYVVREVLDRPNESSGEFRVEWLDHGCDVRNTDQSPESGCINSQEPNHYGSACTDTRTVVFREVNMPFLQD